VIRRCCCGGTPPCVGDSCCAEFLDAFGCGVLQDDYVVNLGTVSCDCWTWGNYTIDSSGYFWCQPNPPPWLPGCDPGLVQSNQCPHDFYIAKVCDTGPYTQHSLWTCNDNDPPCGDDDRGDDTWNWPTGTITAAFPMDLVASPLDPSGNCGIFLPFASGTITHTGGYTGQPNAYATQDICYPGFPEQPAPEPVYVEASFAACQLYPCETWNPSGFQVEPLCEPCDERWDVITAVYYVRNEHQIPVHGLSPNCVIEGEPGCWTYETWAALVRYVRKPVCVAGSETREIVGEYRFACAEIEIPITQIYQMPSNPFGQPVEQAGIGQRLQDVTNGPLPCQTSRCLYGFPDVRCPEFYTAVKLCSPTRSGYGWTFPEKVTIAYA
jgi:hypothetical protein